jgi:hypothetical protein
MKAMGPYIAVGLNGCIGSTDATHIMWVACPAHLRNFCFGKEGFPTLVYNVTCTHDMFATHCGASSFGANNDKFIVRFDEFIADLRTLDLYTGIEYELFNRQGEAHWTRGAYVIVDGGYHRWRATMSAHKSSADPDYIA